MLRGANRRRLLKSLRSLCNMPTSVGIILDGNRRYAKAHGLSVAEGHALGYKKVKDVAAWCREVGIKYLTVYAFSTENWKRGEEEVANLRELFNTLVFSEAEELRKENGAIRFIGDIEIFGEAFVAQARKLEETNPADPTLAIVVALSYGGRQEILQAVNTLLAAKASGPVTEAEFAKLLYTHDIPDPDLIIRTSGEKRLSNFLPWQSVYSELFFVDTHWPAFTKEDFMSVLQEYAARERRFGK